MYEQQKAEFEAALIRSKLQPVPGKWWIEPDVNGGIRAVDGKCCALSPAVLERQIAAHESYAAGLGVSGAWFAGVLAGFDGLAAPAPWSPLIASLHLRDGYEWGQYMRRKYVEE